MIHIHVLKLGDGAEWFMPRSVDDDGGVTSYYRRPFATTTVATSDLVSAVADEEGVDTVDDVLAVLRGGFDDEAVAVVSALVGNGWGRASSKMFILRSA